MSRKIRLGAKELMDVDVTHVSLVDRGANRIPFRMLKSQEGSTMNTAQSNLDLGTLFKKGDAKASRVEAVVVPLGQESKAKSLLESKGYTVHQVTKDEEQNASILSLHEDSDLSDVILMKSDSQLATAVSHVEKSFVGIMASDSFLTNVTSGSFYPHMNFASNALAETVMNIMEKATDKESAQSLVSNAMNQFNSYVGNMVSALPQDVFDLENAMKGYDEYEAPAPEPTEKAEGEGEKTEAQKAESDPVAEPVAEPVEGEPSEDAAAVAKGVEPDEAEPEGDEAAKKAEGGDPAAAEPAEKVTDNVNTELLALVKGLQGSIEALDSKLNDRIEKLETGFNDKTGVLTKSVEQASADASKALEALGAEVVGGVTKTDVAPAKKKADPAPVTGGHSNIEYH